MPSSRRAGAVDPRRLCRAVCRSWASASATRSWRRRLAGGSRNSHGGWAVGPQDYSSTPGHYAECLAPGPGHHPARGPQTVAHNPFCAHAALLYPGQGLFGSGAPGIRRHVVQGLITIAAPASCPTAVARRARQHLAADSRPCRTGSQRFSRNMRKSGAHDQLAATGSRRPPATIWKGADWTRWSASSPTWQGSHAARPCPRSNSTTARNITCRPRSFLQTITGGWADLRRDRLEPDMILRPDFATATAAPWTADWTLADHPRCRGRQGVIRSRPRRATC